jgi:uncharacterized protein YjbJ (UPF0337 family)
MGATIDKAKGKAKTVTGAATGNKSLEIAGHVDQAKGKTKSALKHAKQTVTNKTSIGSGVTQGI